MSYIEINGVTTWYETHGAGEPLVLLHAGFMGSYQWDGTGTVEALAEHFRVFCYDRRAHGFSHDPGGPVTYDAMAEDAIAFIDAVVGGPAHLAGYSDGAIVAMMVAVRRPDLVRRLALLTGNFHYSGLVAGLDFGPFAEVIAPWYDANSPSGPGHAADLVARLSEEFAYQPTLTERDLALISARTLVMGADDDMIHLEHFLAEYRAIPNAELAILPGTSHSFGREKPWLMNLLLVDFLTKAPVPLRSPVQRAPP